MKIVMLIMLLCGSIVHGISHAQTLFVGAATGVESHNETLLVTDSIGILARHESGSKFINPLIGANFEIGTAWQLSLSASFRKNTLSVSAWDPRADTCVYCPVVKGGGPTASEIRINPEIGWMLMQTNHTIVINGGIVWAVRIHTTDNSETADFHGTLMKDFSSAFETNPVYLSLGITWMWKRILGALKYEHSTQYTNQITLNQVDYPFQLEEDRLMLILAFKVFQF